MAPTLWWALLACCIAIALAELGAVASAAVTGVDAARHINTVTADAIASVVSATGETCVYLDMTSRTPPPFCAMVKYPAVVATSVKQQDRDAATMYKFFDEYLGRFNCNKPYSPLTDCDKCRDAYRYWACAAQFPRCRPANNATAACDPKSYAGVGDRPAAECRQLPCLSICQDVVRKCPEMIKFWCPEPASYLNLPPHNAEGKFYPDYSADIADCNKLDRTTDPLDIVESGIPADDFAWPGSFDPDDN